jgi:O-antigen/teichoic acid export membrane protein
LVWLGGFNSVVATLRFAGVLPLLLVLKPTPLLFFSYQLLVAACETVVLIVRAYRQFPHVPAAIPWRIELAPLRPVLKFSLSIAFVSTVGILITQSDKLVLSRVLPLADYAHFTLAVLVAGSVSLLSGPIGIALTPRLARLEAEGAWDEVLRIYRDTTQLVAVVVGAASVTLAFRAGPLLWAWTGDATATHASAPILVWYALGNCVLALASFPYYLQYAKGDLRLHLMGNIGFVIVFLPVVILASTRWGGVGAAWAWLGTNLLILAVWVPIVHGRFVKGLNRRWVLRDWLPIVTAALVAGWVVSAQWPPTESRPLALLGTLAVGLACLLAAALASTMARQRMGAWWRLRSGGGQ